MSINVDLGHGRIIWYIVDLVIGNSSGGFPAHRFIVVQLTYMAYDFIDSCLCGEVDVFH